MAKVSSAGRGGGKGRGLRGTVGAAADYESGNADLLKRAVVTAANAGGALRFGYTSDSGAYAIGIYGDGDYYCHYVGPQEELDITLQDIIDLFEAIAEDRRNLYPAKKDG